MSPCRKYRCGEQRSSFGRLEGWLLDSHPLFFGSSGNRRLAEPASLHRLLHQRADRRRMRTPADRHEVDLAPELGVNHGAALHERMLGATLGHEAKAKPGGN